MLLLTGQRRTETARMRWDDLDLEVEEWRIPAEDTKSGRAHAVPLTPELVEILDGCPRLPSSPFVFSGRGGAHMSGWNKRIVPIREAWKGEPWVLHDLRRTMRSGLTALGVEHDVAEMMLNHAVGSDLRRIYDKHGYPEKRREAAALWSSHVAGLVSL